MSQEKLEAPDLPLHRRVAQSILRDIVQHNLTPHAKIPSEVMLAKQFGVSHGTVTKALEFLVREGVLYRRRPRGTFVADATHLQQTPAPAVAVPPLQQQPTLPSTPSSLSLPEIHKKTSFVGIIVPNMGSDFLNSILISVETMTRSFGYGLSFAYAENDSALESYHIEQFLRQDVCGMIIFPCEHAVTIQNGHLVSSPGGEERIAALQHLQQHQKPFVLVDRYVPEIDCNYVVSDDFSAGYASTQHLISLGYRRIGFITASYHLTSSANRFLGYQQCLRDYAIPLKEELVLHNLEMPFMASPDVKMALSLPGARDRARIAEYLLHSGQPEAVVAMNDFISLQILQTAEEISLNIPKRLALVCSGDASMGMGAFLRVPLTSVIQPCEEMGRQSAYILLNLIAGRFSGVRHRSLPVSLLVRKSSGGETSLIPQAIPHQEMRE